MFFDVAPLRWPFCGPLKILPLDPFGAHIFDKLNNTLDLFWRNVEEWTTTKKCIVDTFWVAISWVIMKKRPGLAKIWATNRSNAKHLLTLLARQLSPNDPHLAQEPTDKLEDLLRS